MGVFGDDDSKDKCNVFIVSSNANWGSWLLSPPLSSRNAMERTACYSLMQMSMAPPEAGAPSFRDPPLANPAASAIFVPRCPPPAPAHEDVVIPAVD